MVNWIDFEASDFEYDFENDELAAHHITIEEAVQVFDNELVSTATRATVAVIRFTV